MNKSKNLNVFQLLSLYLKEEKTDIGMWFVSVFIFALIFKLQDIPPNIALYPAIICMKKYRIYS